MKIRGKLLIVLLTIALVPIIVTSVLHRASMHIAGNRLASDMRRMSTENTERYLQTLVDDYCRMLDLNAVSLELALRLQRREVESRLVAERFPDPCDDGYGNFGWNLSIFEPESFPLDYLRTQPNGQQDAMAVSYRCQSYFLTRASQVEAAAEQMGRLAGMTGVYAEIRQGFPDLILWQFTTLESGLHTSYPGGGVYPDPNRYDPRRRVWYQIPRESDTLFWFPPSIDVCTGQTVITIAQPVHHLDGSFAGVTGLAVPLADIFIDLRLPRVWADEAEKMLVILGQPGTAGDGKLVLVTHKSYENLHQDWDKSIELQFLESDEPGQMQPVIDDLRAGRSGVREVLYRGRKTLWAYGIRREDLPSPIVIIPYERILAQANQAEDYVRGTVVDTLKITGLFLLGVIGVVIVVAMVRARAVTHPIQQIAEAGRQLAEGNFEVHVDIRTGDELQELGEVFNTTGPKLAEREKIKHSLELAMEVQQHLLPEESPVLNNFEVAGHSVYCDETGGDYYDFIDLMEIDPHKIGVAVGDTTGHGIGAALLMASARGVLRSHAVRHGTNLSRLLADFNRHLIRDSVEGSFMSLFYAVLDDQQRSLIWASAGHDPPFWYRAEQHRIEQPGETNMLLGVTAETAFEQEGPLTLATGDILLIGTDGIWEARNHHGEMFGKARLCEIIETYHEHSAGDMRTEIISAVQRFHHQVPQHDDITLVVIKAG